MDCRGKGIGVSIKSIIMATLGRGPCNAADLAWAIRRYRIPAESLKMILDDLKAEGEIEELELDVVVYRLSERGVGRGDE